MLDLVCIYIYSFVKIGDLTYKPVKIYDHKTLWDTKVVVT